MRSTSAEPRHAQPLTETSTFIFLMIFCALGAAYWLALTKVYFFTGRQAAEITVYLLGAITIPGTAVYLYATRR